MARKSDRRLVGEGEHVNIAVNRRAFHDYAVEDRYEAGIVLTGTEVKSLRAGRLTLTEGYVRVYQDEVWLEAVHIPPYEHGTYQNHEPRRTRKLLLHLRQIRAMQEKSQAAGYTLVPLRMYWKGGLAKLEVGVARGKRSFDKRETIRTNDAKREADRVVAARFRGAH